MNSLIVVNLFAELPDQAAALSFESTVLARLSALGITQQVQTRRSWKFPELFNVYFVLQPSTNPELAFDGILASLGEGWERRDITNQEQSAAWNDRDGVGFFSSDVRSARVDSFAECDLRDISVSCSLDKFSWSFGRVARALAPETRQHLDIIMNAYVAEYWIDGAYERMKNRTAMQVIAEYQPIEIRPIASGKVDDVRYELYESNRSDAIDNELKE